MKKTVVVGVTGSIAAYKSIELITKLKALYDVYVIMTNSAASMVAPAMFEKITGKKVFVDLFPTNFDYKEILENKDVEHITIAKKADIFVVAPATANTIAKIAHGTADNFLTTSILATKAPVIICPAMNTNMWENVSTQKNISTLLSYGYEIIEPTSGMLACGYEGKGKLENISIILKDIKQILKNKTKLKGKRILVTSGATREYIDDIRFITNKSSGKMGKAIAEEAFLQGSEVLLLPSENAVKSNFPFSQEIFSTSEDLQQLLKKHAKNFDYIFHTAAVGDFRLENHQPGKLDSSQKLSLDLYPQKKIIDSIKNINPKIHLIGFKAEYELPKKQLAKKALDKLKSTHADIMVANRIDQKNGGFASDNNEVVVVFPKRKYKFIPNSPKKEIAKKLLDIVFDKK